MVKSQAGSNLVTTGAPIGPEDGLPFTVELWELAANTQRVVGRASSVVLARALYEAARIDFPGERITLRRGRETLLDTH